MLSHSVFRVQSLLSPISYSSCASDLTAQGINSESNEYFILMHPFGSLIVELENARRKLRKIFEVSNGTAKSEAETRRVFKDRNRSAL
jgi:hypothetical protein